MGDAVEAGEVVSCTSPALVEHFNYEGTRYDIFHYRLADGRGWIHDFNPTKPNVSTLTRGWVNGISKPGKPAFTTVVPAVISNSTSPGHP